MEVNKSLENNKYAKNNYSLFTIPYKINEYELIKKIHSELNHRNAEDVRKEFIRRKIYYYGFTIDIKYVISKCSICLQKNSNYYKRPPSKSIIFDAPKDRYVLDITELPNNFDNINNNKYLLNIIDHFSKLCKSYALKNKKSDIQYFNK